MPRPDDIYAYTDEPRSGVGALWPEMGDPSYAGRELGFDLACEDVSARTVQGLSFESPSGLRASAFVEPSRRAAFRPGGTGRLYAVYCRAQAGGLALVDVAPTRNAAAALQASLIEKGELDVGCSNPLSSMAALESFMNSRQITGKLPGSPGAPSASPQRPGVDILESRLSNRSGGTWTRSELDTAQTKLVASRDPREMEPAKTALICGFTVKEMHPRIADRSGATIDGDGTKTQRYSRHGYFRPLEDMRAAVSALADAGVDTFVATEAQGASQLGFWAATAEKTEYDLDVSVMMAVPWLNVGSIYDAKVSPVFSRVDMERALKHADHVVTFASGEDDSDIVATRLGDTPAPPYSKGMAGPDYAAANGGRNDWLTSSCSHAICATLHGTATISANDGGTLHLKDGMAPQAISDALSFAVENGIRSAGGARAFAAQVPSGNKKALRNLDMFRELAKSTNIEQAAQKLSAEKAERGGKAAYGPDCALSKREVKAIEIGKSFDAKLSPTRR